MRRKRATSLWLAVTIWAVTIWAGDATARAEEGAGDRRTCIEGARIESAVEAAKRNLLSHLEKLLRDVPADHPMGRLALPVAALLKAGAPSGHPVIDAALKKLEVMRIEKTYGAACYLLALDGLWDRRYQEMLEDGWPWERKEPAARRATGRIRARMEELAAWLVAAQIPGHGSWTYEKAGKGARHDFSNTQFAVLGLEVALKHGIDVPRESLARIVSCFTGAQIRETEPVAFDLTREMPLEEKLRPTAVNPLKRCRAVPGGWAYTDLRRAKGSGREPYASMTAAGASSLLVAIHALEAGRSGKIPPEADQALQAAYAWIASHFDDYLKGGKNFHYTLYSLEKVGDLGGIEKFGDRAWYTEGAERLLEMQERDGGWGSFINTSFALLFLRKATRLFETSAAPVLVTGGGEKSRPDRDIVYIGRLKGYISARALFRHVGETRRTELLQVCEEAVRNYRPDSVEELVPYILALWSKPDRVTSFAQAQLAAITGVKSSRPEEYAELVRQFAEMLALESKEGIQPDELASALKRTKSVRLKMRAAGLAGRRGLRSLAGLLVEELSVSSVDYRRTLYGVLALWATPPVPAPSGDDAAAWGKVAAAWQSWWRERGGNLDTGAPR